MTSVVSVADLQVGDQVAEADGYLFEIVKVEHGPAMSTLYLASDFSPMSRFHKANGGVPMNLSSSTQVYCIRKPTEDQPHV